MNNLTTSTKRVPLQLPDGSLVVLDVPGHIVRRAARLTAKQRATPPEWFIQKLISEEADRGRLTYC